MSHPKFSIVIPLYNKARYIQSTLNRLLLQSCQDFEIIVVNDGSTDNGVELAKAISSPKIRILEKPNGGVSSARNMGIKESRGEWIAFLDADDEIYPNALTEYLHMIESFPDAKVVISAYDTSYKNFISRLGCHIVKDYFYENTRYYARGGFLLAWTGVICAQKDCFVALGGFNETYTHGEDLDMWYRLIANFLTVKSEVKTAKYILETENNSNKTSLANRQYAPIATLQPRCAYRSYSEKVNVGCRCFHEIVPHGIFADPKSSIHKLLHYLDWIIIYVFYLIRFRIYG